MPFFLIPADTVRDSDELPACSEGQLGGKQQYARPSILAFTACMQEMLL